MVNKVLDPLIFLCGIVHNFEIPTCDPLKYRLDKSVLIIPICMVESISTKRLTHLSRIDGISQSYQLDKSIFHFLHCWVVFLIFIQI